MLNILQTINLPTNWIILNGSASTDDISIKSYTWKEVSGPNKAVILKSNETVGLNKNKSLIKKKPSYLQIANATGLTLGLYQFELTVADESNNTASDSLWLKVVQEKNSPPIANAGGDQSITLPVSAIFFNGNMSSDDLGVVKYKWTREDASLAAGQIVADTDNQSLMIVSI